MPIKAFFFKNPKTKLVCLIRFGFVYKLQACSISTKQLFIQPPVVIVEKKNYDCKKIENQPSKQIVLKCITPFEPIEPQISSIPL